MADSSANKMWGGRFAASPAEIMEAINVSIDFDKVLAPQDIRASKAHAQMLADAGMSKAKVKDWFVAHVGRSEADLRRAGKDGVAEGGPGARSASETERAPAETFTRYFSARKDVPIIVAGARNAAISMVFRVFGEWSNTSVPIEFARAPVGASKGG